MKNMVIAQFSAKPGKRDALLAMLQEALPDTRKFNGCNSVQVCADEDSNDLFLIEDWQSYEDYGAYMAWRMEAGMGETMMELLEGGPEGISIRKVKGLDI